MEQNNKSNIITKRIDDINNRSLRAECKRCFGLCCVSLYFSKLEGFPMDKAPGQPCINLQDDFRCGVHSNLAEKGLKGCITFDCFGAGPKVSQVAYEGKDWSKSSELADQMFKVFLIMRQLHEIMWYLSEALFLDNTYSLGEEIHAELEEIERLTYLKADNLLEVDVHTHRSNADRVLIKASLLVRNSALVKNKNSKRLERNKNRLGLIGTDLRKFDFVGDCLRGEFLIATDLRGIDFSYTDFIGADLRDANIRSADFSNSIFLTQAQVNAAKGDNNTKLPPWIIRPRHWGK